MIAVKAELTGDFALRKMAMLKTNSFTTSFYISMIGFTGFLAEKFTVLSTALLVFSCGFGFQ